MSAPSSTAAVSISSISSSVLSPSPAPLSPTGGLGPKAASPRPNRDEDLPHPTKPTQQQLNQVCDEWSKNIKVVLFGEDQIQRKVRELAAEISRDYAGRKILCVGLLTGCFVFLADLLRHVLVPYEVDFMVVSSYGHSTTSSGSIKLKKDMAIDPKGRDVIIIEDLIDTGTTLEWIVAHLKTKAASSVRLVCLLDKVSRRKAQVHVDYVGFVCPDEFVVGYGMDFADQYRCMPFVGVLAPHAYGATDPITQTNNSS